MEGQQVTLTKMEMQSLGGRAGPSKDGGRACIPGGRYASLTSLFDLLVLRLATQ